MADHWAGCFGVARRANEDLLSPSEAEPVFDLASLTKPVVALATHHAIARGALNRTHPLGDILPAARGTRAEDVPLDALLAHRSGLSAHRELFSVWKARRSASRVRLLEEASNAEPTDQRGRAYPRAPVYSDLGYILLGAALEAHFDVPLDEWIEKELSSLGIEGLYSARQWRSRSAHVPFVPTEVVPWRGGLVRGQVHDENAWLLSGHGLSGHAGLFGTARAVAHFGAVVLDALEGQFGPTLKAAVTDASAPREGGTLCAGFDRRAQIDSSAGSVCSLSTFGHLGFTGTSLWCDPETREVVVLLTNRVCPSRENVKIRPMRPKLHDALFTWIRHQREQAARSFTA
ncbi:MAG: serine hydrolase domain-containing protein [Polyangiaceae bacterium]